MAGKSQMRLGLSTARICLYCNAVFIKYGSTLLHHAAGRGKMGCLRYIVEKDGESISRMDSVSTYTYLAIYCRIAIRGL